MIPAIRTDDGSHMSKNPPTEAVAEKALTDRADRHRRWGAGLLGVAALLWLYAMFELFTPYTSDIGQAGCAAPVGADRSGLYDSSERPHYVAVQCVGTRDWPRPVAALALSAPFATIGAMLLTLGTATLRLRDHEAALTVIQLTRR
jgi:hypothetical protein